MSIPILAHGALGAFDEVIFLLVAVIFIALMALAWLKSRGEAPPADEPAPLADSPASADNPSSDHFRLE